MAKAKQLKSGNWNIKVYAGKDSSGRRIYKSFTAATERKANLLALEWQERYKEISKDETNLTLEEAIDKYIGLKSNILSPTSIRGFEIIKKNRFGHLMKMRLNKITNQMLQESINEDAVKYKYKTLKNGIGFVKTVMAEFNPDFRVNVQLPQKPKEKNNALNRHQIGKLLAEIEGDTAEIPILLALWLGMRRSEILALTYGDINFEKKEVNINKALVPDRNNNMILKGTKTTESERTVPLPEYISEKIKAFGFGEHNPDERIVTMCGDKIVKHLHKCCRAAEVPEIRLHDLRHTMASIGLALNIADKYVMQRGGWSNNQTMKNIYQHTLSDETISVNLMFDEYFEKIISQKYNQSSN